MIIFLSFVTILHSIAVSLGVGSSTLAVIHFFVAIADGTIDETERRMMGVVYKVLRVAMGLILVTTVILSAAHYSIVGVAGLPGFVYAQLVVLLVLFVNSMMMTAHLMPSTFGPAIQAGGWYTLGILTPLQLVNWTGFSITEFLLAYAAWTILTIGIVNGIMAISKEKNKGRKG